MAGGKVKRWRGEQGIGCQKREGFEGEESEDKIWK